MPHDPTLFTSSGFFLLCFLVDYILPLVSRVDLEISSARIETLQVSREEENDGENSAAEVNIQFSHTFQIKNTLATPVSGVRVQIDVPVSLLGSDGSSPKQIVQISSAQVSAPRNPKKLRCHVRDSSHTSTNNGSGGSDVEEAESKAARTTNTRDISCNAPGVICSQVR